MSKKPIPVVGMPVTWINPDENPANAKFIQNRLINNIGRDGLTIIEVIDCDDRWLVTLLKNGSPIYSYWDNAWGPQSIDPQGYIACFDWNYLRPI